MLSAEMPLPCSSNRIKNGRILLCKVIIETNSEHYVVSTSTTQQSMEISKAHSPIPTHHSLQSRPTPRLLSRQSRPRRCGEGRSSLQCLPRRSQPLRISWYQALQFSPRLDWQPPPTLCYRSHSQGSQSSPCSHQDREARSRNHGRRWQRNWLYL